MGGADVTAPDADTVVMRLSKRLVGDMVKTHPRRVPGSDKIEAWLADEIRDAIAVIERQARVNRKLTEDARVLLEQLDVARKRLNELGGAESPGDHKMVRSK